MPSRDETNAIHLLNNLAALDFDAIEAYRTAIERLRDEHDRQHLREFLRDHERHTAALAAAVRALGGEPTEKADLSSYLTKGKVVLAALFDDRSVLFAMKTNEDDTNMACEKALEHRSLPPHAHDVVEQVLNDERRHHEWLESRLQAFTMRERHA